jgi:hypothetical protein
MHFLGLDAEASLAPNRSGRCNTEITVILEFTMECVTQTIAKIQDKVQTVLQCKINTNQITEHGGEEREVAICHRRLAVAEKLKKAEMLLSWQRMKKSLAFRSFEPCPS